MLCNLRTILGYLIRRYLQLLNLLCELHPLFFFIKFTSPSHFIFFVLKSIFSYIIRLLSLFYLFPFCWPFLKNFSESFYLMCISYIQHLLGLAFWYNLNVSFIDDIGHLNGLIRQTYLVLMLSCFLFSWLYVSYLLIFALFFLLLT